MRSFTAVIRRWLPCAAFFVMGSGLCASLGLASALYGLIHHEFTRALSMGALSLLNLGVSLWMLNDWITHVRTHDPVADRLTRTLNSHGLTWRGYSLVMQGVWLSLWGEVGSGKATEAQMLHQWGHIVAVIWKVCLQAPGSDEGWQELAENMHSRFKQMVNAEERN